MASDSPVPILRMTRVSTSEGHGADAALTRAVGLVLQWGVILAAVITAVGGVVFLRAHGADVPQFSEFRGSTGWWTSLGTILRAAASGDGSALIETGLLVLIATPVARVVMLLLGFTRERNWTYVMLSLLVLGALSISVLQSY
jgi:uncharacterized membrane protein